MGIGDWYPAISRGTIDGAILAFTAVPAFRFQEVTSHYYKAALGGHTGFTVMNRAAFDALPEEARSAEDERELSCPCFYAADANELHYPIGILEQTPELGNRLTRTMLEETCDRLIGQSRISSGLSGEVYQLLLLAPNHFPSMTAIAEQIGLQERTLRRRLAAEDTSYGEIVDDVRRKLAIEYLQTTRMSVDDVAWKVGFSDSANLRRAVRRWTGKTINEVRSEK